MKLYFWVGTLLALAACQTLQGPNLPATVQAQNSAYVAQATALQRTVEANRTAIHHTALAAETQVVAVQSVNSQLLATVAAGNPPTIAIVAGVAPESSDAMPEDSSGFAAEGIGGLAFIETGTTSRIRESDGCKDGDQSEFPANTPRIYVVTRALQIAAGTRMSVDWLYNGQVVAQGSWTSPNDETNFCIWFYITPDDAAFTPGQWSAQIYANGEAAAPPVTFTLTP